MFLQGTKMEAVAYGDQTMGFDRLLHVGECYDFMRVGFVPTYIDRLRYIFCLCADYYVVLSPQTIVSAPQRTIWIAQCPRTFIEIEDVYDQDESIFASISHTPIFKNHVVNCSCSYSINTNRLCL